MTVRSLVLLILLFAPSAGSADVWLPPSEMVAAPPAHPGVGLTCDYYKRFVPDSGKAAVTAFRYPPQATFLASAIDYPAAPSGAEARLSADAKTTLREFVGADSAKLQGGGETSCLFALYRFSGYLRVTPEMNSEPRTQDIVITFAIVSRDGARLKIGGEVVLDNNGPSSLRTSIQRVRFKKPGLYPVEILYYSNFGPSADLHWFSSIRTVSRKDAPRGAAGIVPAAVLYPAPSPTKLEEAVRPSPVTVGWSDEFDALGPWQPNGSSGEFKLSQLKPGVARLSCATAKPGRPAARSVAVYRDLVVNLDRYSWVGLRVTGAAGGARWVIGVQGVGAGRALSGEIRSAVETRPGLVLLDLYSLMRLGGERRLRVTIHLSGEEASAAIDLDWVRFVSGEETAYLSAYPYAPAVKQPPAAR